MGHLIILFPLVLLLLVKKGQKLYGIKMRVMHISLVKMVQSFRIFSQVIVYLMQQRRLAFFVIRLLKAAFLNLMLVADITLKLLIRKMMVEAVEAVLALVLKIKQKKKSGKMK